MPIFGGSLLGEPPKMAVFAYLMVIFIFWKFNGAIFWGLRHFGSCFFRIIDGFWCAEVSLEEIHKIKTILWTYLIEMSRKVPIFLYIIKQNIFSFFFGLRAPPSFCPKKAKINFFNILILPTYRKLFPKNPGLDPKWLRIKTPPEPKILSKNFSHYFDLWIWS